MMTIATGPAHVRDAHQAVDRVDDDGPNQPGQEEDQQQVADEAPQAGRRADKIE